MKLIKKNLKHLVCFVIAASLFLTTPIQASRPIVAPESRGDIVGHTHEEALSILNQMNIMTTPAEWRGMRPDDYLTRVSFAVTLTNLLGGVRAPSAHILADIDEWHWAGQSINALHAMEVIRGNEDTNFNPDEFILYEQAIAMLLRAMGYSPQASARGGFPVGYIMTANMLGFARNFAELGQPLTRAMAAQLFYSALDIPLMQAVVFGSDGSIFRHNITAGETILSTYLRLTQHTVRVTDINLTANQPNRITVEILNTNNQVVSTRTYFLDNNLLETIRRNAVIGCVAVMFVDETDDTVRAIWSDSEVFYDWVWLMNNRHFDTPAPLGEPLRTITLKNSTIRYNVDAERFTATLDGVPVTEPANLVGAFAKVVVNGRGEITYVVARSFDGSNNQHRRIWGTVERITRGELIYNNHVHENLSIPRLDEIDDLLILLNGEEVTLSDIRRGMFFDFIHNREEDYAFLLVSNRTVNDEIQEWTDRTIIVDYVEYDISTHSFYISLDSGRTYQNSLAGILSGANANLVLDARGDVRLIVTDVGIWDTGFYGVIINAALGAFDDPQITVIREFNGRERRATYPVRIRPDAFTKPGERFNSYAELVATIQSGWSGSTEGERLQNICMSLVFWFGLEGGRVVEVVRPDWISYNFNDYLFRGRNLIHELDGQTAVVPGMTGPNAGCLYASGPKTGFWHAGPRTVWGSAGFWQGNSLFDIRKILINNQGAQQETRVEVFLTHDTRFFSLFNQNGEFAPRFIDWQTLTANYQHYQQSFPAASIMLAGNDFQTIADNPSLQVVADVVVIVENANAVVNNTDRAVIGNLAYVNSTRSVALVFDDELEEERIFTRFTAQTRHGHYGTEAEFSLLLPEGNLGYDLFQFTVDWQGTGVPFVHAGLWNYAPDILARMGDRQNPAHRGQFINLANISEAGGNTLVQIRGFNPGDDSDDARRNIDIGYIFNLDRLTPPGENLAWNYGVEIVTRVRDGVFFDTNANNFAVLHSSMLILEYDPFNERFPYSISHPRYIEPGDLIFFIRNSPVGQWQGSGGIWAAVFQRRHNVR